MPDTKYPIYADDDQTAMSEDNGALIQEILELMQYSTMKEDERSMWTILLPSLIRPELEKLKAVLEKEITQIIDLRMTAQKQKQTPSTPAE